MDYSKIILPHGEEAYRAGLHPEIVDPLLEKVIDAIEEIVEQTQLIAMNAALDAGIPDEPLSFP